MSDPSSARVGTSADRKMSVAMLTATSAGAASLAATILWGLGCLKGHQFFMPDDALVLQWAAAIMPTLYALKLKWDRYIGISDQA